MVDFRWLGHARQLRLADRGAPCGAHRCRHVRRVAHARGRPRGAGARDFLRYLLANNVDRLKSPGKALYSCLLKADGTVLDDLIVYLLREDFFRIIVNARHRRLVTSPGSRRGSRSIRRR
jgi:hypothetical protein